MTPYQAFTESVTKYAASLGAAGVQMDSCDHAPVLMVGWQSDPGEATPFSSEPRKGLRDVLASMRVGAGLVRLTDLIKIPDPAITDPGKCPIKWSDLLFEEVQATQAQAVILLGLSVGRVVLRIGADEKLASVRRTRFQWPGRTKASFFVTDTTENLAIAGNLMDLNTMEWLSDIRAVFEVNTLYFNSLRTVKG